MAARRAHILLWWESLSVKCLCFDHHSGWHCHTSLRIHHRQQNSNALCSAAIPVKDCLEFLEWPPNYRYGSTQREPRLRKIDWTLSASGDQFVNYAERHDGCLLTEPHYAADPWRVSDLPCDVFQATERKKIGGEDGADSMKDAIALADLHPG